MNKRLISILLFLSSIIMQLESTNYISNNQSQTIGNGLDYDIADILLKYGGDPSTVIFQAAGRGDVDAVKKLLDYGLDPLEENGYGNIVDCACQGNSLIMLKYLMEEKSLFPTRNPHNLFIHREYPFFEGIDYFLSIGYIFSEDAIFNSFYQGQGKNRQKTMLPSIETLKILISKGVSVACLSDPKFSASSKRILDLLFLGTNASALYHLGGFWGDFGVVFICFLAF